jgi:capsular polysaccharide biosynthesis protein
MESPAGEGPKRLFVRRSSGYRKLLNEPEIETLLAGEGFAPVEPGGLSITEQVRLFSGAEIIVGASGAAMANLLWCRAGAQALVLHSDHPFKKYPYWDALARVSGAGIGYLAGPRAHNVEGLFEAHDDFSIRAQDLAARIAILVGRVAPPVDGAAAPPAAMPGQL